MRNMRPEHLPLRGKHCFGWIKARNDFIDWLDDGKCYALRKDLEAFFRIPEIRVLDGGLVIFSAAEAKKSKPAPRACASKNRLVIRATR